MTELGIGVLCLSGLGGSGIVGADVAAGLAGRGHRVHLVSDKAPFRFEELEAPVELHALTLPPTPALPAPPLTMGLANCLAELADRERLDVFHVHYAVPNAVAGMLARAVLGPEAPPMVVTLHGTDVSPLGCAPELGRVTRAALTDASVCTAPSRHLARLAESTFGLEDVRVIPNFVDVERFPEPRFDGRRPTFEVVHVSNFRPVKRAGDALEAFIRLSRTVNARLSMIGDGPQRSAVEARVRQLGLAEKVRFLGVRHDVSRWLARSHAALVPSASESFGLSALEAMAAGLPVVGTRVGGLPEVVEHGRTGFLVEVGDTEAMAAALSELAGDGAKRARMGREGRATAKARFHPEAALDAYEALLRATIEESR